MSVDSGAKHETDAHTGTATTGHEWDGIKELNTPLPRWWLWTFYACIVWAVGYWFVYPAWPLLDGYTHGLAGWQSRAAVVGDIDELKAMRAPDEREARQGARCRRSRRRRSCCLSRGRRARRPSRSIARRATAPAARDRAAIPTSTPTAGSGAARSTRSPRRSPTAPAGSPIPTPTPR